MPLLLLTTGGVISAQTGLVKLSGGEMTAREAFAEIRRQTQYSVAYENRSFDDAVIVNIPASAQTLDEAMTGILRGTGFTYSVYGKIISVVPEPAKSVVVAASKTVRYPTVDSDYSRSMVDYDGPLSRKRLPSPEIAIDEQVTVTPDTVAVSREFRSYTLPIDIYVAKKLPTLALKTNLLYGAAALAPNLALEVGLGQKTTLELSVGLNMWNYDGTAESNKKLMHTIVRPEFRWWTCERFNGHFFGIHAFWAHYNVGSYDIPLLFEKEHRYYGNAFGGGITYGYHLMLGKHWGAEFNIGVGAAYLNHKIYDCATCSREYEKKGDLYVGPTRAGITLVFMIK